MKPHRMFFGLLGLVTTLVLRISPAEAAWPNDPAENQAIADRISEQVLPKIAVTPDGGCYVGWFDLASGNYDVYLQRFDAAGAEMWPHNGILISSHPQNSSLVEWDLIADAQGNCVLTFTDARDGSDLDVYAYRVAPDGTELWGADGIALSADNDWEVSPMVAQATDGDFVFVWPRLPDASDGHIIMQRLSPQGAARYPFGGLAIVGEAGRDPAFADIAPSLNGDVIVSWVRDISSYNSPRYLRAQRFAPDGTSRWASYVSVFDAAALPLGYFPRVHSDGSGGAVFVWHRSASNMYNSLAQHLLGDGTEAYPHNGSIVSTNTGRHHLDPTISWRASTSEAFVFWTEENQYQTTWGIYGQKFSPTGARMWGDSGIEYQAVDDTYKFLPHSVPWSDGAICFWADQPTGTFDQDRIVATRVDNAGTRVWPGAYLVVSSVLSSKVRMPVVINSAGMSVMVWEDNRNGDPDVYGQNVNPDGTLGIVPGAVPNPARLFSAGSISCRPNPCSGSTEILVSGGNFSPGATTEGAPTAGNGPAAPARLDIFDAAGRVVCTLNSSPHAGGTSRYLWNGRDARGGLLPSGVYLCRVRGDGTGAGGRITITR